MQSRHFCTNEEDLNDERESKCTTINLPLLDLAEVHNGGSWLEQTLPSLAPSLELIDCTPDPFQGTGNPDWTYIPLLEYGLSQVFEKRCAN